MNSPEKLLSKEKYNLSDILKYIMNSNIVLNYIIIIYLYYIIIIIKLSII